MESSLQTEIKKRIFDSADTEWLFNSLWQNLPNKCAKKFIVCHYFNPVLTGDKTPSKIPFYLF